MSTKAISVRDVLKHFQVPLQSQERTDEDVEEPIACPFHKAGKESIPSARIFLAQGDRASSLYCYTCSQRWNVIQLWQSLSETPLSVDQILQEMTSAFPDLALPDDVMIDREKRIVFLLECLKKIPDQDAITYTDHKGRGYSSKEIAQEISNRTDLGTSLIATAGLVIHALQHDPARRERFLANRDKS